MTELQNRTQSPFRYDTVGSFLRPEALKDAREQFRQGDITADELKAVEDEHIIDLIKKQEAAGLKAVTDGEFRRSWWHLDFFWGLNGIEKVIIDKGYQFAGMETRPEKAQVVRKITGENHPFVDHFKFTRQHASDDIEVRQTMPAPAQLVADLLFDSPDQTKSVYPDTDEMLEDIAKAYGQVFQDLYDAGARTVQLDDCSWDRILVPFEDGLSDEEIQAERQKRRAMGDLFVKANNLAIEERPADDFVITSHFCRGNYRSHYFATGSYDQVEDQLLASENVDAFYLEYDDPSRSGGFESLSVIPEDTIVVLGIITTKTGELEDRQEVIDKINEAAKYHDINNLCLSPQCGFASTEEGNNISEEEQWAKIELVKSIAEEVWGA